MGRKMHLCALLPTVLLLSACDFGVGQDCTDFNGCTIEGTVDAVFVSNGARADHKTLLERAMQTRSVMDAAQFSIDVAGSTVTVPSNGLVTIELIDSQTGAVQAQNTFSWVKSGTDLVLANANAVNAWAMAQGGTADSLAYALHPFTVANAQGVNQLNAGVQYEGVTYASATSTWTPRGGGCGRLECHDDQLQ